MNKWVNYMDSLMNEQNEIIETIIKTLMEMDLAESKHIRDYHKRELDKLYDDLLCSTMDIQKLYQELRK